MPNIAAVLLLASAGTLEFGDPTGSADVLRCDSRRVGGDPDMPVSVLVIDDELFEGDASTWYADDNVYGVAIVCWRWVEEYLGLEVRLGATYVLTQQYLERMRESRLASLEALIAAQDHHRNAHGAYAEELDDLSGFGVLADYGVPKYMQLELVRTEAGWGAGVGATKRWLAEFHGWEPARPCYAFVGTPPEEWKTIPNEDRSELVERQPVCLERRVADETGSEGG